MVATTVPFQAQPAYFRANPLQQHLVNAADAREKARQLITNICQWPQLFALLAEEAQWRQSVAGVDGLYDAGVLKHGRGLSYHPNSAVARQIVCHFVQNPGLLDTDQHGRWWAIRGDAVGGSDATLLGLAVESCLIELGGVGVCESPLRSPHRVVQTAMAQDAERAVQLLIWLERLAAEKQSLSLTLTSPEIVAALTLGVQTSAECALAELADVLACAEKITLRALELPAGRWRFFVLREVPAVRLVLHGGDLVSVELSELLPMVLARFLKS